MNALRRKALRAIVDSLDLTNLEDAKGAFESLRDEESEALEAMPESFRDGDKGERAQSALDAIEEAISAIEEAMGLLEDLSDHVDTACE